MLVLSRKKNETIHIGDDIKIVVVEIRGDKARIGIDAPKEVPVHRDEVYRAIHAEAGPMRSLAEGAGDGGNTGDGPATIAHFCGVALDLVVQVLGAKEFVGPLCRERLVVARDKLTVAMKTLNDDIKSTTP